MRVAFGLYEPPFLWNDYQVLDEIVDHLRLGFVATPCSRPEYRCGVEPITLYVQYLVQERTARDTFAAVPNCGAADTIVDTEREVVEFVCRRIGDDGYFTSGDLFSLLNGG